MSAALILVDTSIWVDHLRMADERMSWLLGRAQVLLHPFVIGELALHAIANRTAFLDELENLPSAIFARHDDVMALIATRSLYGRGIGYVDAHLYASTLLTPDAQLWTKDKRLLAMARESGLAALSEN